MTPEENSYSFLVRDAIVDRVQALPFFADFTFKRTKNYQVQPEDLPYCGIYFLNDRGTPEGDADAGEIRHRVLARFGFSIMVQNNDPEEAEETLDQAFRLIETRLFTDPTLYHNNVFKIQSFPNFERSHSFGTLKQETPFAEARFDLTADLGTDYWPPYVPDYLETVHIQTNFPVEGPPIEQEQTVQVEAEWILETMPTARPLTVTKPALGKPQLGVV